jgi:hypothetical protein
MQMLKDYVDKQIAIRIPALDDDVLTVKLRAVESAGIWIESQKITNEVLGVLDAILFT